MRLGAAPARPSTPQPGAQGGTESVVLDDNYEVVDVNALPKHQEKPKCILCERPPKYRCTVCNTHYCCVQHLQQDFSVHEQICAEQCNINILAKQGPDPVRHEKLVTLKRQCIDKCYIIAHDCMISGAHERAMTAAMRSLTYAQDLYLEASPAIIRVNLLIAEINICNGDYTRSEAILVQLRTQLELTIQQLMADNVAVRTQIMHDFTKQEKCIQSQILAHNGNLTTSEFVDSQFLAYINLHSSTHDFLALIAHCNKLQAMLSASQGCVSAARYNICRALYQAYIAHGTAGLDLISYYTTYIRIMSGIISQAQIRNIHSLLVHIINNGILQHFLPIISYVSTNKKALDVVQVFNSCPAASHHLRMNIKTCLVYMDTYLCTDTGLQRLLCRIILGEQSLSNAQKVWEELRGVSTTIECDVQQKPLFQQLYELINATCTFYAHK